MYQLIAFSLHPAFRPRLTARRIQEVVAGYYAIPVEEMTSQRRARTITGPRQVAMYLTRELTPKSLPDIGRLFGGRDHTTVLHAIRSISGRMERDHEFAESVETIRHRITMTVTEFRPRSEWFRATPLGLAA